ncbi:Bicoid-interacting protein 3-domain-containing protein [Radiomyces spectabilis]|uniref:Bicoid-interacting protein 3-domain-containing protein n=1 Tax=Radiomyces spectabilis TaxID=64574 RepID=UPI00221EC9CE|nr:Bicoid-interacting protein 3-domain-containing protein [Radiomyces spectabilis]KAI8371513.1 Bicoid-interacting protein 3-domain-containing protein [Radiomyces spectabilis]
MSSAKRRHSNQEDDAALPQVKRPASSRTRLDVKEIGESSNDSKLLGPRTGVLLPMQAKNKKKTTSYIYGNYPNYYSDRRNKSKNYDSRLDVLPSHLFKDKHVLDIGCNSGNITITIAKRYHPVHIHGVDIDDTLIKKANSLLGVAYSLSDPSGTEDDTSPLDIGMRFHYFPTSMTHMFGFIALSRPATALPEGFPYNVTFEAMDWMESTVEEEQYDTVLALSISKWIHIHRGDEGIKDFFKRAFKVLKPGGVFVLEPQRYESYARRAKLSEDTQNVYEEITLHPEDYQMYLLNEIGFKQVEELGTSENENKGFERPLYLYTK